MYNNLTVLFSNSIFYILLSVIVLVGLKLYSFVTLFLKKVKTSHAHICWVYLLLVLLCSLAIDCSWLAFCLKKLFPSEELKIIARYISRIAWSFSGFQYFFLILFLEGLVKGKRYKVRYFAYLLVFTILSCLIFLPVSQHLEWSNPQILIPYFDALIMSLTLLLMYRKTRNLDLPKILKNQIRLLLAIVGIFSFIDIAPHLPFPKVMDIVVRAFYFQMLAPVLLTLAIFFSARRIIGMRFLNYTDHVQASEKNEFIDKFKDFLGKLGDINYPEEIRRLVQSFFQTLLSIPTKKTHFYIRALDISNDQIVLDERQTKVETFLSSKFDDQELYDFVMSTKIFIKDEIAFSDFYEDKSVLKKVLRFMEDVQADIFVPIFGRQQTIIAYVIVDHNSRPKQLYTDVERDEILICTSYLSNIIFLMQHKNLDSVIAREKEFSEEIYGMQKQLDQHRESIRSFAYEGQERKVGVIFYKNGKFIFANQTAHELIRINVNVHPAHSITKALKQVACNVEEFKNPQSGFVNDGDGNRIVIAGLPNIDKNNVILTIYYPELADIVNHYVNLLKNPAEIDYLLYLETTKSGQLINKLIPGSGQILLQFKIDLLKIALGKKAILLELADEDALCVAEIIHLISLRHDMHILKLEAPHKGPDLAIKLFGINPIFGIPQTKALFEQLKDSGTLFIENVHFLDLEVQEKLAHYLKYGFYAPCKSNQNLYSSVRIITSSLQPLQALVQEGKFSADLLAELNKTTLSLPSLLTLSEQEFLDLAQGYIDQALQSKEYKNLLELTESEKNKLMARRPITLKEFKLRIQNLLINKSKKSQVYDEIHFDPAYHINDPDLAEAARLGKFAVRDPKMLSMLWEKFRNQSQIADFLGVNRSTVNRKLREFNLTAVKTQ